MKRRGFFRTVLGLAAAVLSPLAVVSRRVAVEPMGDLMFADGRYFRHYRRIKIQSIGKADLDGAVASMIQDRGWTLQQISELTSRQLQLLGGREL